MSDAIESHLDEAAVHGIADGTMDPVGTEAAGHLARCAECAAAVARIRALLATVGAAPRAIEPPRDLWPEIRRRAAFTGAEPQGAPRWRRWAGLAAAAVLLVAVSSIVTRDVVMGRKVGVTGSRSAPPPPPVAPADTWAAGLVALGDYARLDRELAARLEAHRKSLRPETIARVERNLAIIDAAIVEIRAALADEPTNRALRDLLRSSYGQKAALLRQVSRT